MMKPVFYFLLCLLVSTSQCEKEDTQPITPSTSLNKIMPLGASRVEGARPHFESYRYELWKLLVTGGWDFDYIGTNNDDSGLYPEFSGKRFDPDHEGYGGFTSSQLLNGIEGWLLRAGAPDIVLFSSPGGNDALLGLPIEEAIANVNAIIDAIQAVNPKVTIIMEQMAPALSSEMTPELTVYFQQMQQQVITIANNQTTNTSKVLTIDMHSDFKDLYLADDVHYNEAGARFIAERYHESLKTVLQ